MRAARVRACNRVAVVCVPAELKNRFIAIKAIAQSMLDGVAECAPWLLQPHDLSAGKAHVGNENPSLRESFDDLLVQIQGGLRLCLTESVIRMIAHAQVRTHERALMTRTTYLGRHAHYHPPS